MKLIFTPILFFVAINLISISAPTIAYADSHEAHKKTAINFVMDFFTKTVSAANSIPKVEDGVSYTDKFSGLLSFIDWDFLSEEIIQFSCPSLSEDGKKQFKDLFPNHLLKSLISKTLIEGMKGAKLNVNKRLIHISEQEFQDKKTVRIQVPSQAGTSPESMHQVIWLINIQGDGSAKLYTIKFDGIDPLAAKKEELKSLYSTLKDKPQEFLDKLK
jgi:hypothetical protein